MFKVKINVNLPQLLSLLSLKMPNLGDLKGFALNVTSRYN